MTEQLGTDRIAIISDVHGNMTALEAVLRDISAQGITRVFNLGDLVGKGPRSAEVVDRCREVCAITVQGNWDAIVSEGPDPDNVVRQWNRSRLGEERLAYLASLPGSFDFWLSGRRARIFHASQKGIHHRVHETGTRQQHRDMFCNTDFTGFGEEPQIVGCGDVHTAYALNFENKTLFNAGSVGNPLDVTLASYAILEGRYGARETHPWSLQFVRLPYDIEAEIKVAEASGMPTLEHYKSELRTAIYRGITTAATLR
jgi:predicted phosphodiesterase